MIRQNIQTPIGQNLNQQPFKPSSGYQMQPYQPMFSQSAQQEISNSNFLNYGPMGGSETLKKNKI